MNDRSLAPFDVEYLSAVSHEHQRYLDCGGSDYFSGWLTRRSAALEARIEALERARQLAISEWSTWKDVLMSNMREADWQETMDGLRAPAALRSKEEK